MERFFLGFIRKKGKVGICIILEDGGLAGGGGGKDEMEYGVDGVEGDDVRRRDEIWNADAALLYFSDDVDDYGFAWRMRWDEMYIFCGKKCLPGSFGGKSESAFLFECL